MGGLPWWVSEWELHQWCGGYGIAPSHIHVVRKRPEETKVHAFLMFATTQAQVHCLTTLPWKFSGSRVSVKAGRKPNPQPEKSKGDNKGKSQSNSTSVHQPSAAKAKPFGNMLTESIRQAQINTPAVPAPAVQPTATMPKQPQANQGEPPEVPVPAGPLERLWLDSSVPAGQPTDEPETPVPMPEPPANQEPETPVPQHQPEETPYEELSPPVGKDESPPVEKDESVATQSEPTWSPTSITRMIPPSAGSPTLEKSPTMSPTSPAPQTLGSKQKMEDHSGSCKGRGLWLDPEYHGLRRLPDGSHEVRRCPCCTFSCQKCVQASCLMLCTVFLQCCFVCCLCPSKDMHAFLQRRALAAKTR